MYQIRDVTLRIIISLRDKIQLLWGKRRVRIKHIIVKLFKT